MLCQIKAIIIGQGRLGKNLAYHLPRHGIYLQQCYSGRDSTFSISLFQEDIDCAFLSVRDDQLQFWVKKLRGCGFGKPIFHSSGCLVISGAWDLHPLGSFTEKILEPELFDSIYWVTSDQDAYQWLVNRMPKIGLRLKRIMPEKKSLYHAGAVLAGPGSSLLWRLYEKELLKMGLPNEALLNFVKTLIWNWEQTGSPQVTGPWVRGDQSTLSQHRTALARNALLPVYEKLFELATGFFPTEKNGD